MYLIWIATAKLVDSHSYTFFLLCQDAKHEFDHNSLNTTNIFRQGRQTSKGKHRRGMMCHSEHDWLSIGYIYESLLVGRLNLLRSLKYLHDFPHCIPIYVFLPISMLHIIFVNTDAPMHQHLLYILFYMWNLPVHPSLQWRHYTVSIFTKWGYAMWFFC